MPIPLTWLRRPSPAILTACLWLYPASGHCWGDRGHEIIGMIAEHYLDPTVRTKVRNILRTDPSGLTPTTGVADEATWADKFRDSDRGTTQTRYLGTRAWHFVDIEIDGPDVDAACFEHPVLPPEMTASTGPPEDCIVDKIGQFSRELRDSRTPPAERRLALQFLLHLVGDLHQPLHVADDHDRGGNDVQVRTAVDDAGTLHRYWDTVFVERAGSREAQAAKLIAGLSGSRRRTLASGTLIAWTWESYEIGRRHVYGNLPKTAAADSAGRPVTPILLTDDYAADAATIVPLQLQRAGVRLARLLNEALR